MAIKPEISEPGVPVRPQDRPPTPGCSMFREFLEELSALNRMGGAATVIEAASASLGRLLGPVCGFTLLGLPDHEGRLWAWSAPPAAAGRTAPDERVRGLLESSLASGEPAEQGGGTGMALPLTDAHGEALGALFVERAEGGVAWSAEERSVLLLVARYIGFVAGAAAWSEAATARSGVSLRDAKEAHERRLIRVRLREARGNIAKAARTLAMDRGQLSRLLKRHGVDKRSFRTS